MKYLLFIGLFLIVSPAFLFAQVGSVQTKKLSFSADFRFRFEQDWNSIKSDGSYREDRFRLRYRLRFGLNYRFKHWGEFGVRIRSGFREKQQDPHLTLGEGFDEFNSFPIGLDKLFFKARFKKFMGWIGKNTFPFEKQNELFWTDNINPDGVFASVKFNAISSFLESLKFNVGHFMMFSSGFEFDQDQYFQGVQIVSTYWSNRLKIFPSFYYFNKMPNIPDDHETYRLDYAILHIGTNLKIVEKPNIDFGLDYYHNFENLNRNDSIPQKFKEQKEGLVVSLGLGELKKNGDWTFGAYYTYLERYAIVDFLAQNDWARWDYSSQGSPDGRLSNLQGIELRAGYLIRKNFRLKIRYFIVEQLISYDSAKETGNRIRLDLDIGF